jgi:hypothetical protein
MAGGVIALAVSAAIGACYTGDQTCSEAYNPNDVNDHCPYGPPGGPGKDTSAPACPTITADGAADCSIGFTKVYERLTAADGGNCTAGGNGCHTSTIKGIAPFKDPQAMLDALSVYKGEQGTRKYFDRDNPTQSWWVCNLKGDTGTLMPTGGTPRMKSADIKLVNNWLFCGGTLNGAGGTGGGSTM